MCDGTVTLSIDKPDEQDVSSCYRCQSTTNLFIDFAGTRFCVTCVAALLRRMADDEAKR
jgi:hypothetical protein